MAGRRSDRGSRQAANGQLSGQPPARKQQAPAAPAADAPPAGATAEVSTPAPAPHPSQTPGAINPKTNKPWDPRTIKKHAAPAA